MNINRNYQVSYLAGYSKDGKTIYIDKRLPEYMITKDGKKVFTDKYLAIHEKAERDAEYNLGYKYQYAHEFYGTKQERDAVEKDGCVSWKEYQSYMLGMVKKLKKIDGEEPPDLDDKPEKDTHSYSDDKTIKKHQMYGHLRIMKGL